MEPTRKMLAMLASKDFSSLRQAGYSASSLRQAGYSASSLRQAGERCHRQSTFGPDADPETNLCKTPMCTAGHLVNLGGKQGYDLKAQAGWAGAARLIHDKAHPGWPCQDFGMIPQAWAMAYIEEMAERESLEP